MQFLHRLKIYSFSFGYTLVRNESSLMKYQNIGKCKYCGTTYIKQELNRDSVVMIVGVKVFRIIKHDSKENVGD